jgi:Fe-S-cluster containining protein
MNKKLITLMELSSTAGTRSQNDGQEEQPFVRMAEGQSAEERYLSCLSRSAMLANKGENDEAREYLIESAVIALQQKDDLRLACSHEKLGDLSAAEENWFGALHHYRYSLRTGGSRFDRSTLERIEGKANAARNRLQSVVDSPDPVILPLSREYVYGNMAISFVHRDIFLKSYFARCLECSFCHDWCCSFGADIDIHNVEKIQQRREEIQPFVRPADGEWFDADHSYYEEYAGNQYTRIKTQGSRCVFISKDQRGCGLHRYAISQKMDYHDIKPLICILFPLSFEEGILSLAGELEDGSLVCAGSGVSAYQAMKNELAYYFGNECLEELNQVEENVLR